MAEVIVAYAFSPIGHIPDFIPRLGYLDDLILLPLAIVLVLGMIPPVVMAESRTLAQEQMQEGRPVSRAGADVFATIQNIVVVWDLTLSPRHAWPW